MRPLTAAPGINEVGEQQQCELLVAFNEGRMFLLQKRMLVRMDAPGCSFACPTCTSSS